MRDLVVLGGSNVDALQLISDINEDRQTWNLLGILDDFLPVGTSVLDSVVLGPLSLPLPSGTAVVQSIVSRPSVTKLIIERVSAAVLEFPNLVHPASHVFSGRKSSSFCGRGNLIFQGASIQPQSRLGDFNYINIGTVIGHDISIGSFNSFGPGVLLSGRVAVGDCCYFGSGAVVTNGAVIADGCFVCAGSVVVRSVDSGLKVMGNPARVIGAS